MSLSHPPFAHLGGDNNPTGDAPNSAAGLLFHPRKSFQSAIPERFCPFDFWV
jgi:hypothetical protein